MKLSPQKGGHGHITAYRAIIGSAEARSVGFINPDGTSYDLNKIVDVQAGTITIKRREGQAENTYTHIAVFSPEGNSSYSVYFPQVDGCFTEGDSFDAACRMAADALRLHLLGMVLDGEPLPAAALDTVAQTHPGKILVPITVHI